MKSAKKLKFNSMSKNYTNTFLDKGRKDLTKTREPNSSSFAMEGNNDGDGLGDTYSSHSTQYHHEPSNLNIQSHHAPIPPSPNPAPSESTLEPPGDLSPSPASRIVTETPSSLLKLERKGCNAALSSSVHISPSSPCTACNILLSARNGLGEESGEESGMMEDSSLVMGERGGGPGVAGLCQSKAEGWGWQLIGREEPRMIVLCQG